MSALTKSLHPDEKIKAGKLGATMTKAGVGIAVVFLGISIVLGADRTATVTWQAVPLRLRDRLDVHLQHLRRHAVARPAAPPGARPLGDRRCAASPRR